MTSENKTIAVLLTLVLAIVAFLLFSGDYKGVLTLFISCAIGLTVFIGVERIIKKFF